jgi:outer membrane protein assembly factor BamB
VIQINKLLESFITGMIFLLPLSGRSSDPGWDQFRGPNGNGVSEECRIPEHLSNRTPAWRVASGSGHSSPCLFGNCLILTSFESNRWHIRSYQQETGQVLWDWSVEAREVERGHRNGSPAASSVAIGEDGELVAYSGAFGLVCLSPGGELLWALPLPTPVTQHGAGTSPVLAGDRLILCLDQDIHSYLLFVNRHTGHEIWRKSRPGFRRGFSTPLVLNHRHQPTGVLVAGTLRAVCYDLNDGTEKWSVSGLPNELCATPVLANNKIFISGWTAGAGVSRLPDFSELLQIGDANHDGVLSREEAPAGSPAQMHFPYVDANKDGEITAGEYESLIEIFRKSENALLAVEWDGEEKKASPRIAWKQQRGLPYVPSPLAYRDHIYLVRNGGMVSCYQQLDGAIEYLQERLGTVGDYYASPVAGDGKILFCSQSGVVTTIEAGGDFRVLDIWDTGEPIYATPALSREFIFVRTNQSLMAIPLDE